jgi:hypothetical protein
MARKHVDFRIEADAKTNRDAGKLFYIEEMPCARAERWSTHMLHLLARSGLNLSAEQLAGGMQAIAQIGPEAAFAYSDFEETFALMEELMACVQIKPDPLHIDVKRALMPDDIEEMSTRLALKREALKLHVNFSPAEDPST